MSHVFNKGFGCDFEKGTGCFSNQTSGFYLPPNPNSEPMLHGQQTLRPSTAQSKFVSNCVHVVRCTVSDIAQLQSDNAFPQLHANPLECAYLIDLPLAGEGQRLAGFNPSGFYLRDFFYFISPKIARLFLDLIHPSLFLPRCAIFLRFTHTKLDSSHPYLFCLSCAT